MAFVIVISLLAIIGMFVCIFYFPTIRIGNHKVDSFWMPVFIAAFILLITPFFDKSDLWAILISNSSMNPLKILALFICVSILSIGLDETGFFRYIASIFIDKCKGSQKGLFITLYCLISILTIFTSNDIVILTFTPFILYFSKRGNINPIPYLVMEFAAANTWSMMLPIGNPTNIYLSTVYNLDFIGYVMKMILPAFLCGISSFVVLVLLFKKELSKKVEIFEFEKAKIENKPLCIIALVHLIITTILLAISHYIHLEMWFICVIFAISLLIVFLIYTIISKNNKYLKETVLRVPYNLIPFVLSMFTIIMALDSYSIFENIGTHLSSLDDNLQTIIYLVSSTLSCNIVNNIPMTMMYGSILSNTTNMELVYATIIGSNIGAILTPVGALAGIMWTRMLKHKKVSYPFIMFLKNGAILTSVLLLASIIALLII